jgi:DNA-binding MarR family transcriptional regulator
MKSSRPGPLAAETWQLLFELLVEAQPHVPAAAAACELTEAQCHVLRFLEPGATMPMRRLAERLHCDASNITGIVDRLEARGLVERRACPHDRRVKELALTPAGAGLRARILERLGQPPEPIGRLSAEDMRLLCTILRKALGKP